MTAFTTVKMVALAAMAMATVENDGDREQRRPQHDADGVANVCPEVLNMFCHMAVWTDWMKERYQDLAS